MAQRLDDVTALAFSPEGRFMATASGHDETIVVWRTADWSEVGHVQQHRSVSALAFSPDGSLLYVGGGGPSLQIHAVFEWRQGKRLRDFIGHRTALHELQLSRDGRTMATASLHEREAVLWEAPSGRQLRTWPLPEHGVEIALRPDGGALARQTSPTEVTVEYLDGSGGTPLRIPLPGRLDEMAYTPDGAQLLVATQTATSQRLTLLDASQGTKLAQTPLADRRGVGALMVSPDGQTVALDAGPTELQLFGLPQLARLRTLPLPGGRSVASGVYDMVFSPDGRWLAVGSIRSAPLLFDTRSYRLVRPYEGHGDHVKHVHFSADGATIRTIGRDGSACSWDATTLEMRGRVELPADCSVAAVRESDGRYALCLPGGDEPLGSPAAVRVVDAASAKVVATLALPVDRRQTTLLWPSGRAAFLRTPKQLVPFDPMRAKVKRAIQVPDSFGTWHADDARWLYLLQGGQKRPWLSVQRLDVTTGAVEQLGRIELPTMTGNRHGLVPGGKHLWIGDPDLYVFERATLAPVISVELPDLDQVAFDSQGRRFAAVTGKQLRVYTMPRTRLLVSVALDAQHGRARFSPNGARLLVLHRSGQLEIVPVPAEP